MKQYLVAAVLTAITTFAGLVRAETMEGQMQALMDGFHADYGFPGATAAIVLPDGNLLTVATGLADQEAEATMAANTRMLAASIGKTFVAMTVLTLESDGVFSRADLVSEYLGNRDWFTQLPNQETMTIGDLLRHTSACPTTCISAVSKTRWQGGWLAKVPPFHQRNPSPSSSMLRLRSRPAPVGPTRIPDTSCLASQLKKPAGRRTTTSSQNASSNRLA
ncbi:beta-lactamase family protein [Rhodobacteraceae bacterium D3-12]|nr:beta-lactamase family protein [Rhodobacteraceae bacterium D3-12]